MQNIATIEKIEDGFVFVSTVRKGACGKNCAICNSCSAQKVYTKAFCDLNVSVGDSVVIESNAFSVVLTMFLVFILPLLLPIILYVLSSSLGKLFSIIGTLIGIVLSCFLIYYISRSKAYLQKITPKITSINNKK